MLQTRMIILYKNFRNIYIKLVIEKELLLSHSQHQYDGQK
jgi:hypothetical protein